MKAKSGDSCMYTEVLITLCLLVTVLVSGCATQQSPVNSLSNAERQSLLVGEPEWLNTTEGFVVPTSEDLLKLNNEMQYFAEAYIPRVHTERGLKEIGRMLGHRNFLGMEYNPNKTYSAEDAFYYSEGNCLTYAYLYVAMARARGFKARFQEVKLPPFWSGDGKALIRQKHINIAVMLPDGRYSVEFEGAREFNPALDNGSYPSRIISDQEALAEFYSNHGVEALLEGQYAKSFVYFRSALEIAPKKSDLWLNLGVLYRQSGHSEKARLAFHQALDVDPGNTSAMMNLSRIYQAKENQRLANILSKNAEAKRSQDPYYLYALAQHAYKNKQYSEAIEYAQQALSIREDHNFEYLLGVSYWYQGKKDLANLALTRAKELASGSDVARYNNKIQAIAAAF